MEHKIDIQKVWSYEQQILDVFADFCKDHNLKYSLAYGTLLGAARHKGFIPWDDDIDVMMPREDYNKFIHLWQKYGDPFYTLVNHDVYPEFGQDFTKLMMNKTTFISSKNKVNYPQGIFIDIFPLDRVAPNRVSRNLQRVAFLISMLYRRGYHSGEGGAIRIIENILFVVPKSMRNRLCNLTSNYAQKWNGKTELQYVAAITFSLTRVYYPANLFEKMTQIEFSGKNYACISDYDTFLKNRYGDYMKLPPKEEQVWKHRPILVDYEHDADELEEI